MKNHKNNPKNQFYTGMEISNHDTLYHYFFSNFSETHIFSNKIKFTLQKESLLNNLRWLLSSRKENYMSCQ